MEGSSTLIIPFVLHVVAFHYYELSIGGSEVKIIVQLLTWTSPHLNRLLYLCFMDMSKLMFSSKKKEEVWLGLSYFSLPIFRLTRVPTPPCTYRERDMDKF